MIEWKCTQIYLPLVWHKDDVECKKKVSRVMTHVVAN